MRAHRQNWLDIFKGFRIALDAKKIVLGTLGVYVSVLLLLGLALIASRFWSGVEYHLFRVIENPVRWLPGAFTALVHKFCPVAGGGATPAQVMYLAGVEIIMLAVWAYFGGAIARIAAVDFAQDQRLDIGRATSFAGKKFGSFFWSPIVPFVFILIFVCCNLVLGAIGRIPAVGPVVVGVLFFLSLIASFIILLLAVGGVFGMGFMWPTIAMEGTDAFDAISRAFNYLYARPWKTIWCWLVALVYGVVSIGFVAAFACIMTRIALATVGVGMGAGFEPFGDFLIVGQYLGGESVPTLIGMVATKIWIILVGGFVIGFAVSYKLTALTLIYAVLRRDVDGTDMSEVYLPEAEEIEEDIQEEPATKPEETPSEETPSEETPEPAEDQDKPAE